jgi:carbon monoxide dehydrogenase subunit G
VNLKVSRAVTAPASVVWSIMIDLEGSPTTISAIQSIEILPGATEFGVGTRWRETRTMFGKQATEVMWISEVDPGTSYVAKAESHGAQYTTIMEVVDTGGNSSEVSMDFSAEAVGTMAKFMGATVGKLFENATRKALAQDLDDIAVVAEARM